MDQFSRLDTANEIHTRHRWKPSSGVMLVCNPDTYEFYIDAACDHAPTAMRDALQRARHLGLEVLDDEVEFLTDEVIRIWLAPLDPLDHDRNPLR